MGYLQLAKLRQKLYFGLEDVAAAMQITPLSARVACSRYVKKGIFIRLKNNFYLLSEKWEGLSLQDFLLLSNFLQVPSYISFASALFFYEITTQVQRGFFESACLKRSTTFEARGKAFYYYKLQKQHYFGFIKKDNLFIATAEKAFADALYLYSFGRYKMDFSSLDLKKLNQKRMRQILRAFPERTRKIADKLCKNL